MIHNISILNPTVCPTFDYIKKGIKTVEGRKNSKKYQGYKEGDILIFSFESEIAKTKIVYIHKYATIEEYLYHETLERTLPGIKTMEEAVSIYNLWSSEEERNKLKDESGYGFLGIGISKID